MEQIEGISVARSKREQRVEDYLERDRIGDYVRHAGRKEARLSIKPRGEVRYCKKQESLLDLLRKERLFRLRRKLQECVSHAWGLSSGHTHAHASNDSTIVRPCRCKAVVGRAGTGRAGSLQPSSRGRTQREQGRSVHELSALPTPLPALPQELAHQRDHQSAVRVKLLCSGCRSEGRVAARPPHSRRTPRDP